MITVTINGQEYNCSENANIVVKNGNIQVNGDVVGGVFQEKITNITITGDVGSLTTTSGDVTVNGNVTSDVESVSGDVRITGLVGGNVRTTSGDIKAQSIQGRVSTVSGDIN